MRFHSFFVFLQCYIYKNRHLDGVVIKNLPFVPEAGQVIYVESSYDEKINKYIQKNYEWLVKEFAKCGFSFCYMPLHIRETIRYALPNASEKEIEQRMSDLPSLLQYAVEQVEIKPSLFFGIDLPVTDEMGNVVLQYVEIEPRW